ncbi:MAG: hypothetical protein J5747_09595, partial [Spirochaetaceae bacterium]|nr:hypothetical protein [Spirochaetaceae bacterium]
MHQMFAFKNLEEGQTLYDVRTGTGDYSLMMFDPAVSAGSYMAAHGEKPVLYYALGAYYADVRGRYGDQWLISVEELYEKEAENFRKAYDGGVYDAFSLSELATSYFYLYDTNSAEEIYKKKATLYELNPNDNYNYALILWLSGRSAEGLPYMEKSIEGYADIPEYQCDAYIIAARMCLSTQNYDRAEQLLIECKQKYPDDYRITQYGITLYALLNQNDKAIESSFEMFAIAPTNPAACQLIMQEAQSAGNMDFLPGFFDQALQLYAENSGAVENLYFHYAYTLYIMGRNEEAWDMVQKAREVFTNNGTLTQEIEDTLDQIQYQVLLNAGVPPDAIKNMME